MERQVKLLLPRAKRGKLVKISHIPAFKELDKDTQQAIEDRIKNFPTEIAIELAFLPEKENDIRSSLKVKLERYKVELACENQESCIDMMKDMNPSALIFPIEQAAERLLEGKKNNATLEKLLSFATPYACTRITSFFSLHGSKIAAKACAGKALKDCVLSATRSAQMTKNFELTKSLVPFLSPLGIVKLLELSSSEKIGADRAKEILSGLPKGLADNALRIAVRGSKEKREISAHCILPKALQAAIDEVYLFAKRIKFDDELLEKAASETAKAQGKEIERAVSTS